MRTLVTVADAGGSPDVDVVVDALPGAPTDDVLAAVGQAAGRPGPWWSGAAPVHGDHPWSSDPAFSRGAVLTTGSAPAPAAPAAPEGPHLVVVAGPHAGATLPLPRGPVRLRLTATPRGVLLRPVGRDRPGPLGAGPAVHVELGADGGAWVLPGTGLATVGGSPVTGPLPWGADTGLGLGGALLAWRPAAAPEPPAHLDPHPDGPAAGYACHRAPRLAPAPGPEHLACPPRPAPHGRLRLSLVAGLVPLAGGLALAGAVRQPAFLLLVLAGPVVALAGQLAERRSAHRDAAGEGSAAELAERHRAGQLAAADALLGDARDRERRTPRAATVLAIGGRRTRRLWERRPGDPLLVRLATGPAPAGFTVDAGGERRRPTLPDAPVTVDLDAGALGIAGPPGPVAGVARWVCAQLAVLHSPADVALAVLAPGGRAADGLGWLPHLRTAASGPPQLATDPAAAAALARTLVGLAAARTPGPGVPARTDRLVVLLDGSTPPDPETAALWRALLDTDPRAGVRAVCLAAEPRLLPAGCRAVAVVDAAGGLTLQRDEAPPSAPAVAEQVAADRLEPVARSLAPLSDAGPEGAGALPRAVRLASLLGLTDGADRAGAITRRWDAAAADALPAVLGQGPGGPLTVDLVADGPHALVAGTTGAGKSELLQTLVTSLAATHPPEALTFVLLDYKGGAAFSACGRLPHVGGLLTDLDEALAARALRSLHAEVRRRERLLAAVGAADLPALRRLRGADPAAAPGMPRVVLVVDEFAALAEELPDFLGGLVDVARRGRSLGVHLVLATQRPAGVVTAEIRANTALRICLRVTDPADSLDVLDAADAARLAPGLPGRAFVRRGPLAVEPVQVARVSGHTVAQPAGPPRAWRADADEPPSAAAGASAEPATDLALLVDAARAAAARRPATPAAPPWLPPLPVVLPLGELPAGPDDRPAVGLLDLPDEQAQPPLRLDLTRGGGLVVAGGPRSGRTTALRTLALAAARAHPDAVQLYVVDCGGGALAALGRLPHCGAVVDRTDPERIRRLLERLRGEVDRRARLLADGGCADLAEFNAAVPPERRLPALLLLLDRWDVFAGPLAEADLGRGLAAVLGLVADGSAAGLRVVVTGDRTVLSGALGAAVDTRIVLRLPDPADAALAGIDVRSVPRNAHPGRGTYVGPAPGGGRTTVAAVQVAVAADQPSGAAQVAAVHRLADAWRARLAAAPARRRPLRVDPLPQRLTLRAMAGLPTGPGLPLGVGGDELGVLTVQPGGDGPGFTVAGPPRSGRSTALATLAAGLLAQGTPVVVLVPRPSPLRALADRPGVTLLTDPAPSPAEVAALLAGGAAALLVDDADALAYAPVGDVLTAHLLTGPAGPVVVAGSYEGLAGCYRGFCADVRGSGAGLLLAPDGPLASQLLGVAVPRPTAPAPPGRGLLVRGGRAVPVQVAVADEVRDPAGAAARG